MMMMMMISDDDDDDDHVMKRYSLGVCTRACVSNGLTKHGSIYIYVYAQSNVHLSDM